MIASLGKSFLRLITVGFLFLISSCDTGSDLIGTYKLYECEYSGGSSCIKNSDYLKLKKWNRFELQILSKNLEGSWKYYDNNDASIVELHPDGFKNSVQCVVGLDERAYFLEILNPDLMLKIDTLTTLEMKKALR